MRWPWKVRAEEAHREAEEAAREREEETGRLTRAAEAVVREAVRHRRENHFQQAIEDLMRRPS